MLLKKEVKLSDYKNKYIFTRKDGVTYSFYLENEDLIEVDAEDKTHSPLLHSIYVGKVKNVSKNLSAAFVEYEPGKVAYLEVSQGKLPLVLNRQNVKHLASGDEVLIQIIKEPLKTKDAVATTNLTLSGTYCVVSSERQTINVSNKLDKTIRSSLKKRMEAFCQEQNLPYGAIIRTNVQSLAEDSFQLLTDELLLLQKKLMDIIKKAQSRSPFTRLYDEASFVENKCKDISIENTDLIVTDDEETFGILKSFPSLKSHFYEDTSISLMNLLGLSKKVQDAFSKKVWLKCGGYLVIEVTEALTVIDVNSGKCVTKKNKEDMITLVNTQAAKEIMHQIRLRNLSGIIIVDFMKHSQKQNEETLMQYMETLAGRDRVQTDIIDMTPLGLLEITRRKISKPLHEKISIFK